MYASMYAYSSLNDEARDYFELSSCSVQEGGGDVETDKAEWMDGLKGREARRGSIPGIIDDSRLFSGRRLTS